MSADEIHVGDTGTVFTATFYDGAVVVDISTATTKQLWFKPPNNGAIMKKDGTFVSGGTTGKLSYTTLVTDLSVEGNWSVQGYVVMPSGTWYSDIYNFYVCPNLA